MKPPKKKKNYKHPLQTVGVMLLLCARFELDGACCYCIGSESQLEVLTIEYDCLVLCKCCVTLVPSSASVCCPRGGAVVKLMSQLRSTSFKALLYLSS